MFRVIEIIGVLLVAGGVIGSYFSVQRGAGIAAINIGIFVLVCGGLAGFLWSSNAKKNGKKK